MKAEKAKGLGRGLDALIPSDFSAEFLTQDGDRIERIHVEDLQAGAYQPRTQMDEDSLRELTESIKSQGIISPILVRPIEGARYEIVAGERRYRAAVAAGLRSVPAIVRELGDQDALALGLIENIQRENLNPIEEAHGIERLIQEFGYTHEEAGQAVGRSRSSTTNLLRLLTLAPEVQDMVLKGLIEMGHARALIPLQGAQQVLAAREIARKAMSVRQAESMVKRILDPSTAKKERVVIKTKDDERLEESLSDTLGAVVHVTANKKGRGRVVIEFSNLDQLQGIVERIQKG